MNNVRLDGWDLLILIFLLVMLFINPVFAIGCMLFLIMMYIIVL